MKQSAWWTHYNSLKKTEKFVLQTGKKVTMEWKQVSTELLIIYLLTKIFFLDFLKTVQFMLNGFFIFEYATDIAYSTYWI